MVEDAVIIRSMPNMLICCDPRLPCICMSMLLSTEGNCQRQCYYDSCVGPQLCVYACCKRSTPKSCFKYVLSHYRKKCMSIIFKHTHLKPLITIGTARNLDVWLFSSCDELDDPLCNVCSFVCNDGIWIAYPRPYPFPSTQVYINCRVGVGFGRPFLCTQAGSKTGKG